MRYIICLSLVICLCNTAQASNYNTQHAQSYAGERSVPPWCIAYSCPANDEGGNVADWGPWLLTYDTLPYLEFCGLPTSCTIHRLLSEGHILRVNKYGVIQGDWYWRMH